MHELPRGKSRERELATFDKNQRAVGMPSPMRNEHHLSYTESLWLWGLPRKALISPSTEQVSRWKLKHVQGVRRVHTCDVWPHLVQNKLESKSETWNKKQNKTRNLTQCVMTITSRPDVTLKKYKMVYVWRVRLYGEVSPQEVPAWNSKNKLREGKYLTITFCSMLDQLVRRS